MPQNQTNALNNFLFTSFFVLRLRVAECLIIIIITIFDFSLHLLSVNSRF